MYKCPYLQIIGNVFPDLPDLPQGKFLAVTHTDTKIYIVCQPQTSGSFLTWIFCAGWKIYQCTLYFYPRISASVRIFLQKAWIDPGVRESDVCLRKQPLWSGWSKDPDPFVYRCRSGIFMWMCVGWVSSMAGDLKRLEDGTCGRTYKRQTGTHLPARSVSLWTSRSIFAFVPLDSSGWPVSDTQDWFCAENTDAEFCFPMHMWQGLFCNQGEYKNTLQILEWQTA